MMTAFVIATAAKPGFGSKIALVLTHQNYSWRLNAHHCACGGFIPNPSVEIAILSFGRVRMTTSLPSGTPKRESSNPSSRGKRKYCEGAVAA
jgi:hypothetical protein